MVSHVVCLFIVAFLVFCLLQYRNRVVSTEGFEDSTKGPLKSGPTQEYLTALSQYTSDSSSSGAQGPPGPPGPAGPPGAAYTAKGRLMNKQYKMVADRFFGTGPNVAAYLAKENLASHQTWTLQSDNQLANLFGGCLAYSTGTDGVYIGSCTPTGTPPPATNQWTQDTYGRIVSSANPNACLTVSTTMPTPPGAGTITDAGTSSGASLAEGTPILTTAACDMTPTQTWYIG